MAKPRALTERMMRDAMKHLREVDDVMGRLIDEHPRCPLVRREYQPFHTLTRAIIGQQLSAKAADTIGRRVAEVAPMPFEASVFVAAPVEALRAAGLSCAKTRYIRELAERVCSGRLRLEAMCEMDDEEATAILCELPGIGRWTAEMFLIFGLKRPDVLSLGDAGLQRAAKLLYGGRSRSGRVLERAASAWSPYRSVASWYLWRHLEVVG